MAIRKISRIQHRRGLKTDLPPKLNEGEFGWCLDTKELFIGNSDGERGNSQVLTQWTPNDKLILHSYQGATGIPAQSIPRPIGSKLDDYVSVRDYGAIGNGIADDYAAIQAAIHDRYGKAVGPNTSLLSGFVTIFIPAGTYRITKSIALYPFIRLQGEGAYRTKIILDSDSATCVIETADNHGNTTINIGADGAIMPAHIEVYDIWVEQPKEFGDVISINRATHVKLENLKLTGSRIPGSNVQTNTHGIVLQTLGNVYVPQNITIQGCEISNIGHAVYVNDPVRNIRIHSSEIHDCWKGISLGLEAIDGGPSMIKVSHNHFYEIDSYGINCNSSLPGVTSIGNTFFNVGVFGTTEPIIFGPAAIDCTSIADQVYPPTGNLVVKDHNLGYNLVIGTQQNNMPMPTPNLYGPITLFDNNPIVPVSTGLLFDPTDANTIHIDYSIARGQYKRVGRLTILTNGTINTTVLQDEYTSLGPELGVDFGFTFDLDNMLVLTYLTSSIDEDATFIYTILKWFT